MIGTASEGHFIEVSQRIGLDFYIEDVLLSDEFLVVTVQLGSHYKGSHNAEVAHKIKF